nr:unnamed protein product [Callosobruchus chinensis]
MLLLQGTAIQVKEHHRILGIIFVRKLLRRQHIEDLALKCKKALNIFKCLSNIKWGANKDVLRNIYKALM